MNSQNQIDHHAELRTCVVGLSGLALVGDIEDEFEKLYLERSAARMNSDVEELIFDLADVTFTETATLQTLIAITLARKRDGLQSRMKLPAGPEGATVRDFLRRWQFPKALSDATGIPFIDFVVPEDHRYFKGLGGDRWTTRYAEQLGRMRSDSPDVERDIPRFFPFTTWKLDEYQEKARVSDEALDAWTTEPIVSILDKRLSSKMRDDRSSISSGTYVASRIVFEAMTNATRHPGGSLIQMSSTLRSAEPAVVDGQRGRPEGARRDAHFTVSFWDDGKSMASTLKSAIDLDQKNVRQNYPTDLDTTYLFKYYNGRNLIEERSLDSTLPLDSTTPQQFLLLAAIFPGVTCDASGKGHRVHRELEQAEPVLATLGMGLFALVRTVVDKFDGSVAFRTGAYFMNVKRAKGNNRKEQYQVKVVAKPPTTPAFLGNLVTVRLPLQGG